MSSYQFVNSLASCYAGQQPQQQPRPTPNSPGEPMQAASPAGGDYYNPNAASTSYPTPCYSPQQHYPQHPYATPASGMQHTAPTGMIDYTQLQPQPRLNATATSQQHAMHAQHTATSQHHPQPHHPQQQQQQQLHADPTTPLLQGSSAPSAPSTSSCKYADSTSSTGVASPQDLTTSTSRNSPTPLVAPGTSKAGSGLTSPPGSSSRSSVAASAASPPSGSSRGVGEGNSTLTTASSASSPASSTSSTSSTGNNSSNKGNPSGTNPPQIYPWMKRVHIGQTKFEETKRPQAVSRSTTRPLGVRFKQQGLSAVSLEPIFSCGISRTGKRTKGRGWGRERKGVIQRTKTRSTCPRGSKRIKQRSAALVALTLVAPRDLLRGQHDSVSGEFDEELMVL
ncbi:hypothetical protein HN011_000345 [Eciton burchellii]|nr:hypothetical protein HN011_000345 [Eciton burchellii]